MLRYHWDNSDECGIAFCFGQHLPNCPRGPVFVRQSVQRHLPAPQAPSLPMVSPVHVVLGVAIARLAGAIAPNIQLEPAPKSIIRTGLHVVRVTSDEVKAMARTPEAVQIILRVFMIAAAQIFTAAQFCTRVTDFWKTIGWSHWK